MYQRRRETLVLPAARGAAGNTSDACAEEASVGNEAAVAETSNPTVNNVAVQAIWDSQKGCSASKNAEEAEANKKNEAEQQAVKEFRCDLRDFRSNCNNGLNIHMAKKHSKIEQLNDADYRDENFSNTRHYWAKGRLGTGYQTHIDIEETIKNSEDDDCIMRSEALSVPASAFSLWAKTKQGPTFP